MGDLKTNSYILHYFNQVFQDPEIHLISKISIPGISQSISFYHSVTEISITFFKCSATYQALSALEPNQINQIKSEVLKHPASLASSSQHDQ